MLNDDANGKFVPEDGKKAEIKQMASDDPEKPFVGLTKDELMKFAKDPFWVKIRWTFFILFWIMWLAMFVGAIVVIAGTQKCVEPSSLSWWQKSPVVSVDVYALRKGMGANDSLIDLLRSRINYLSDLGVQTILLKFVFNSNESNPEETLKYDDVDMRLHNVSEFKHKIIDYAKSKNVYVILNLIPNHSGKMEEFIRSELRESGFSDFYVWYPENYKTRPSYYPNNWMSVYDGSAWEWQEPRNQFYLHQFGKQMPEFNFYNPNVIQFFIKIFKFWLQNGVVGFHLDKAEYMVEDEHFTNESFSRNTSFNKDQYGFYTHIQTMDLPLTSKILSNWSTLIHNESGILTVSGGVLGDNSIANLIIRPISIEPNISAVKLAEKIVKWKMAVPYPAWKFVCTTNTKQCFPENATDGLLFVQFLLPGTPVIDLGNEMGLIENESANVTLFENTFRNESNDPDSHYYNAKKLITLRDVPSVMFGELNVQVLNGSVLVFTRIKSGNPGYLVAWNLGVNATVADFSSVSSVPDDITVVLKSRRMFDDLVVRNKISSKSVRMPSMGASVFSFVPKSE